MNNSSVIEYLKNHKFEKHENGNMFRYGLNSWGCDSVISYNNDIWKFVCFLNGITNKAVYYNKDGLELILDLYTINDNKPIRMQVV